MVEESDLRASRDILAQPLRINETLTIPNRIVMAPMTRNFAPHGVPGEDVAAYYRRRAAGGVGLIVTEGVGVDHPASIGDAGLKETAVPVLHGDAPLAGWKRAVDLVHAAGGIIFPQLWHQGPMRIEGVGEHVDAPSVRPSGIWGPRGGRAASSPEYLARVTHMTTPMTAAEVDDVLSAFVRSSANAKAVGFDGIALHGAHGYLLDSFLWSETNRRDDEWGGPTIVDRTRFVAELVRAIRLAVGPELPIMYRFSQWKLQDLDATLVSTPAELEQLLRPLIDAGVDMFDASTRMYDAPAFEGSDLCLAGWTRKVTGKPTMAVGGIGIGQDMFSRANQQAAENVRYVIERMERGEFDLVGVGRALMADPDWARHAIEGLPSKPYTQAARDILY